MFSRFLTRICSIHGAWLGLVFCALLAASPVVTFAQTVTDPLEPVNRRVYAFNQTLDDYVIRPVALGYRKVVPGFARTGVSNFFNNLDDIRVVTHDLLQFKMNYAVKDSGRLLVNSTLGLAGFIDVAGEIGLEKRREDFGQTLAVWGVGRGPYLVLPVFGNTTVRDGIAMMPDAVLNPVWWMEERKYRLALTALETIDTRVRLLGADRMARGDKYRFVRDAVLQRREYLIHDGSPPLEDEWGDWDEEW